MSNSASMRPDLLLVTTRGVKGGKLHSNPQGCAKLKVLKGYNEPENSISIDVFKGSGFSYAPRETALINITFSNGGEWYGTFDELQKALSL